MAKKDFKGNDPNSTLSNKNTKSESQENIEDTVSSEQELNNIDDKSKQKPTSEPKKEDDQVKNNSVTEVQPKPVTKSKKKTVGRPPVDPNGRNKKEYTKLVNIAIPLDLMEKIDDIKICYGNNLTQYINALIKKDIEANYNNYKSIADNLNQFK